MPRISVIVPVYNMEKNLNICVESILNQTFRDLEVILVNDGSTDNSAEEMEKLKEKDSRIVLLHKKNGGASSARNAGLDAARGEYIGFVDSDDTIAPEYFETLYRFALIDHSDFVCFGQDSEDPHGDCNKIEELAEERKIVDSRYVLENYEKYHGVIWCVPFDKLLHKSVMEKIRFYEGIIYEDEELLPKLIKQSRQITILPMQMYRYTLSENSVMRSGFSTKRFTILDVWKSHYLFFKEEGLYELASSYLLQYMTKLEEFRRKVAQPEYRQFRDTYKKYHADFKSNRKEYLRQLKKFGSNNRVLKAVVWVYPILPGVSAQLLEMLKR